MIFKGKSINDITDDEIDALVQNRIGERQHLEFKVIVNYKEDEDRLEILHDVVSLANGGGGYLIVGIRDDGKGRAVKYEPGLVGNTESIRKAIQSLCQDHISERIKGLEVVAREVKGNPLVIVLVPASERIPHMVTFKERTDFWMRYYDGKRAMTMGEIRETFSRKGLLGSLRNDLDEFGKFIGKRVGEDPDLMDRTGSDQIDAVGEFI
ncbi:ATP-binding protein [Candidatus Poribacteria bacterium]|nr:ATP-binding protein [Candidatus Poribacteria bacterium]